MGLIRVDISLANANDAYMVRKGTLHDSELKQVDVTALVDTGAYMLAINETIALQLDLPVLEKSVGTLADGSSISVDIVGPVELRFKNRRTTVDAMVLPGDAEVLLGAIPMEGMDVLVDPLRQELIINPNHPFKPQFSLK